MEYNTTESSIKKATKNFIESLKQNSSLNNYQIRINIVPNKDYIQKYNEPFGIYKTEQGVAYSYIGKLTVTERNSGLL